MDENPSAKKISFKEDKADDKRSSQKPNSVEDPPSPKADGTSAQVSPNSLDVKKVSLKKDPSKKKVRLSENAAEELEKTIVRLSTAELEQMQLEKKKSIIEKRMSRRGSEWGASALQFGGLKHRTSADELAEYDGSRADLPPDPARDSTDAPRGSADPPRGSTDPPRGSADAPRGSTDVPRGSAADGAELADETVRKSIERKQRNSGDPEKNDEYHPEEDDFNQEAFQAQKAADEEIRERKGSWGEDLDEGEEDAPEEDEDDLGGGMQGLLGRSELAKEELAAKEQKEQDKKRKRKRRVSPTKAKGFGKDRDKKGTKGKKKTPAEEAKEREKLEEEASKIWLEPNYVTEEFVSPPLRCGKSKVSDGVLKFYESYGYDSERRDNLQMIDEDTLIFISGNYLHFYSIKEQKVKKIQRTAVGNGLGHVAIHPSRKYFAVGEKGLNPIIAIYTWPGSEMFRILRRGTTKGYAFVNFNTEGQYLCSQGMDPDYMLTIWDWDHEKILLRYKSYSQDIFRATFNPSNPGDLVTCGVGHIRFWRMAETFTGLKLQGAIGRFGKTEISDIEDFIAFPDGKVLSGSEWGDVLVWDGGLIVCEIRKAEGVHMHEGEITSLTFMDTGELLTVGSDGCIKMWDAETIDVADTIVGDSGIFEVEAIHELKLATDAKLLGVLKNLGGDSSQNMWFLQDAWGRVWDTNLTASIASTEYTPNAVFYCPGGGINAIAVSPVYTAMVVGTSRGHLWLIEYINKEVLSKKHYLDAVTKLVWLPTKYDNNLGVTFIAGFGDGHVRNFSIQKTTPEQKDEDMGDPFTKDQPYEFSLNQILRFAKGCITLLKLDEINDLLYISGEDRSIWACSVYYDDLEVCPVLEPLAYFTAPFPIVHMNLHPTKDYRMIIASKTGRVAECRNPDWEQLDSTLTFNQGKLRGRRWWYKSAKCVKRKMERKEARKIEKDRRLALLKEDLLKRKEAGINTDPEIEIARLNEEFRKAQNADDDDPVYIPEKPCPVLAIYYHINPKIADPGAGKTFFVHVGDYDAGYVYECKCTKPEIGGFHPVPPTPPLEQDIGVRSYLISKDDEYLIFGMDDGSIRIMERVNISKKRLELKKQAEEKKRQEAKEKATEDEDDEDDDAYAAKKKVADAAKKAEADKKRKAEVLQMSIFPYDLENFLALPMHDPNRGAVNALAWSHDGQFLFSVGADGSIFSYRWDPQNKLDHSGHRLPRRNLPEKPLPGDFLLDSEQRNAYTVEEMRAKEEEDRLYGLSEEAKEDVRKQLREMKAIYRSIKQRNLEIPQQFRVQDEKLKLPREIYAHIQAKITEECDEVYRIHEYESAETIVQLDKIRKFYFDPVETPHIVVKDISHVLQVHTIRNRKVTKQFEELIEKNKDIIEEELRILREHATHEEEEVQAELPPIQRFYAKDVIGEYESKLHTYDIETVHNIRRLERRLTQRYERECAWQKLMAKKINPDYITPEDQKALDAAQAQSGAFRLKTSESYLGENISVAERRQKIIDMKIKLREAIQEFNKMLIEARNEKPKVLAECRRLEKEIKKIHVLLPDEYKRKIPPIYDMEPEETPESVMDITQEEVEAEEQSMLEAAGLLSIKEDILEEFFGVKKPEKAQLDEDDVSPIFIPPPAAAARQAKVIDLENESVGSHRCRKCIFTPQTELEKKRFEIQFYPTLYRQEMLFKDLLRIINYFYQRIKFIHDKRVQLEIDHKIKTIGLLTMISELDIAKEFEAQEKAILERLRAQQAECKDAKHNMERIKKRLVKVNLDMKRFEADIQAITKEVETVIGGKGRFSEYLWKVFKKKIKIEAAEEEEDVIQKPLSSSESSDSSESTSQDSGSDLFKVPKQKLDINNCPDHLDRNIFNKICELRQRKATLELEIDTEKRIADKINHEYSDIEKVYQKFEGRLTDISEEIRVLQRRRQKRMNDLKLMVILRADQIQCMDMDDVADLDGEILDKLALTFPGSNNIILFPDGGTTALEKRSAELMKQAKEEKEVYKAGRKMLVRLREELKKSEKQVEELKAVVSKEMILKFGCEVDLDKIAAIIINLELLDQEILLDKMKTEQYRERARVNAELSDVRYQLTQKVKQNSKYNMLKAMMLERRRDVEYYIWKNEGKKIDPAALVRNVETSGEAGGGDAASNIEDIIEMTKSLHNQSKQDTSFLDTNDKLDEEIRNTRRILKQQTERIKELKEVLNKCRTKTGLPPLIPICPRVDQTLSQSRVQSQKKPPESYIKERMERSPYYVPKEKKVFPTTHPMPEMNQYCDREVIQCGVQTIYKGNITPKLRKSVSRTIESMQDVDKKSEEETRKIFNDEEYMEYDYSDEEGDVMGGAAAVREFQETLTQLLPDEKEEFIEYLEESGAQDLEAFEDYEESVFAKSGGTYDGEVQEKPTTEETETEKKSKQRKLNRKSRFVIDKTDIATSEVRVMSKVRRMTLKTEALQEGLDAMSRLKIDTDTKDNEEVPEGSGKPKDKQESN